MSNLAAYEKLDQAIDQMLASADANLPEMEKDIAELAELAADLRHLPRENFKTRLQLELEWEAAGRAVTADVAQDKRAHTTEILPSLLGKSWGGYPVRRSNFALSAALHALMMLAVGAGFVMVKSMPRQADTHVSITTRLEPYVPPAGLREDGGGGSGGAAEKLQAKKGVRPAPARVQLTPAVPLENQSPKLMTDASVVAPPELSLPKARQTGDPLSLLAKASNGAGVHGGMGGKSGAGVGSGDGPGYGVGAGGGCCEGVYNLGNGGVTVPRAIYAPEPEFSEEARKVKHQGEVTLLAVIGADGLPRHLTVVRSLGMGLDEKALAAVRTWRFEPARKDGHPVAVQMNIVVNFHLY
jgi:periplasmic protein TonB